MVVFFSVLIARIYEHIFYKYFVRRSGYNRPKCKNMETQYSELLIKQTTSFFLCTFLSYMSIYSINICPSVCRSGNKGQKCERIALSALSMLFVDRFATQNLIRKPIMMVRGVKKLNFCGPVDLIFSYKKKSCRILSGRNLKVEQQDCQEIQSRCYEQKYFYLPTFFHHLVPPFSAKLEFKI